MLGRVYFNLGIMLHERTKAATRNICGDIFFLIGAFSDGMFDSLEDNLVNIGGGFADGFAAVSYAFCNAIGVIQCEKVECV